MTSAITRRDWRVERDYASHLPVLRTLLAQTRPHNVLEFGAGYHSTPEILRRDELVRLVSIEPDPQWRRKVAERCADPRLVLRSEFYDDVPFAFFDLILIDDGTTAEGRVATIRRVLADEHPITIVHDADVPEYIAAIKESAIYYTIVTTDPPTAVVWQ